MDFGARDATAVPAAGLPATAGAGAASGTPKPAGHPARSTFGEILHGLNPLQHLPVIGMIYRAITGDEIDPAYRIGGALVTGMITGGPIGALASAFGSVLGSFAEDLFHRMLHDLHTQAQPAAAIAAGPTTPPAAPPGSTAASPSPAANDTGPESGPESGPGNNGARMTQAIAAYARTQTTVLAAGWQAAQEGAYAARGSG